MGRGDKGQLGYPMTDESSFVSGKYCQLLPKKINDFSYIKDIICGSDFTFAIDKLGKIYSWGNNNHNQLARESDSVYDYIPSAASRLCPYERVKKLCCGWMHGMCMTDKGEVMIWGNPFFDYNNTFPDISVPEVIGINCGKIESKYSSYDNSNRSSGSNAGACKVVDIASGFHHFCAIVEENPIDSRSSSSTHNKDKNTEVSYELYTWGANEYGQCGVKIEDKLSLVPTKINFNNNKIIQAVCGAFHTVCIMTDNKVYGFGHN